MPHHREASSAHAHKIDKKSVTRRDFLKLAAKISLITGISVGLPYLNSRNEQSGSFPEEIPTGADKEVQKERVKVSQQIKKISALVVLINDQNESEEIKEYFLDRYQINKNDIEIIANNDKDSVDVGDLATIIDALKDIPAIQGVLKEIQYNYDDNLGDLTSFIAKHNNKSDWKTIIEENNLGKPILDLGLKGKRVLENLSIDSSTYQFQKSLVNGDQVENFSDQNATLVWVKSVDKPHLSVLNINSKDSSHFYQFALSMESQKLKPSMFILNRLEKISAEKHNLNQVESNEFIAFESWVYDEYRQYLSSNPNISEDAFFESVKTSIYTNKPTENSLTGRIGLIYKDLVQQLGVTAAQEELDGLLHCSPSKFKSVLNILPPGVRSIFHTKSSRLRPVTSFQVILNNSKTSGTLDSNKIFDSIKKYSGNLYLQNIVDRKTVEGEEQHKKDAENSMKPQEIAKSILSGDLSLEEYASLFFGARKTIIANENGDAIGTVVSGRVTEPVQELPKTVVDILRSTEGLRWKNGREYLKTIFKRNLVALVSDEPSSGGSDPTMQLTEIIFPSPFDTLTSLSDSESREYTFRRPDLYGSKYLFDILIPAVRDGGRVPQIYDYSEAHASPANLTSSNINRLCAKMESYILARDLTEAFGEDALDVLYVQYVPIGNATGEARGMQMQGLETGANYYFDKTLPELSQAEICVLVGMIQSPINYGPVKWDGKDWVDNHRDCFDRAITVASLCEEKIGLNKNDLVSEIEKVVFKLKSKPTWVTTISDKQIKSLRPGTLESLGTNLELGIRIIQEPSEKEYIPRFPEIVDLPNRLSREQETLENWLSSVISKDRLRLETRESSSVSKLLTEASKVMDESFDDHDSMIEKVITIAKKIDPEFDYSFWGGKKFGEPVTSKDIANSYQKEDPKYELWNSLYELHNTDVWQCGQCAILLNSLSRLESGKRVPTVFVAGFVKNWIGVLEGEKGQPNKEYFQEGDYEVISLDKKVTNPSTSINNPTSLFNVGDIVISWRGHDYGHASTVIDKGADSQGRNYITIFDANYRSNGKTRIQTIWDNNLPSLLYPGKPHHMAIIRELNVDHGQQIPLDPTDKTFLDQMVLADVKGQNVVLPGFEQQYLTSDGKKDSVVNPGISIYSANENGFESAYDPTNLLGVSPIPAGNAIKPFIYAYSVMQGVDPKRDISILPGQLTLDGSDQWVANAAALGFNLQGITGTLTFEESLACGVDVPFQVVFRELMESNPSTWSDFQNFLGTLGIPLVDWEGNLVKNPSPLGATGRDVLFPSLDKIGYALDCLLNPETLLGDIVNRKQLIDAFTQTRNTLLNGSLRKNLIIGDENPINEVGTDLTDVAISNATNDVPIREKTILWSGTNLGDTGLGVVVHKNNANYKVTVSIAQGQVLNTTNLFTSQLNQNLNKQYSRSRAVGNPGLGLVTAEASLVTGTVPN